MSRKSRINIKQITDGKILGRRQTEMSPGKYVVPGLKFTYSITIINPRKTHMIKAATWDI